MDIKIANIKIDGEKNDRAPVEYSVHVLESHVKSESFTNNNGSIVSETTSYPFLFIHLASVEMCVCDALDLCALRSLLNVFHFIFDSVFLPRIGLNRIHCYITLI